MADEEVIFSDQFNNGIQISRKRTIVEKEFSKRQVAAHEFVSHLPPETALPVLDPYIPSCLSGAIFCGHLVTD